MSHDSMYSILFLLLLQSFIIVPSSNASILPQLNPVTRPTQRNDLIGFYTLHPQSHLLAPNRTCPLSLETRSFQFAVNDAPTLVTSPHKFNIIIPHALTLADNQECTAGTNFIVVESGHSFVTDQPAAVRAWAGAGNEDSVLPWLLNDYESFVPIIAHTPWVIGYDFGARVCKKTFIPAHAAYLWFQPPQQINISSLILDPQNKYMFLAFGGRKRHRACAYVAQRIGGQLPFPPGPVSDPSDHITHSSRPVPSYISTIHIPSGIPIPSDLQSPTPSVSPTPTLTPSPSFVLLTPAPIETTPSPVSVFESIENDPNGPLGAASETSIRSSCFPASAMVTLHNGNSIPIHQLTVGQQVRVSSSSSSSIFFFSHRISQNEINHDNSNILIHPFLNISVSDDHPPLLISDEHYIYVKNEWNRVIMIPASKIQAKYHKLILSDGNTPTVGNVQRIHAPGLYAPHTLHGDIVVNNFLVSTYTTAIHPKIAHHLLLLPVRWLYRIGLVSVIQPFFDKGASQMAKWIPSGPNQLQRFT